MLNADPQTIDLLQNVRIALKLSSAQTRKLQDRLERFSAFIRQPRKDDGSCNSTPFVNRWHVDPVTSHLTAEDPRYATEEECKRVYETLLALLFETHGITVTLPQVIAGVEKVLGRPFQPGSLACIHTDREITRTDIKSACEYSTGSLGSYEIPISYLIGLDAGGRHEVSNVGWMKPLHINYTLRQTFKMHLSLSGAPRQAINNALDKIQVKAYCTDKVTMPPYFSNRDIRWATWTDSPQYASHHQCAMIEMELMAQLYEFANAPKLDEGLASSVEDLRGKPIVPGDRICFVTGRQLDYEEYSQAAINPKGGKSAYHVGHIMPLTRGGKHSWENIAWLSDDGNRIQGNDTLVEIEKKLVNAVEYHIRRDAVEDDPPLEFYDKIDQLWNLLNEIKG